VIGKKIGRGRFGNVYIVQHFETQSVFALKVLDIKQIKD
jgi:serine/threonine protein kinase